MGPGPPGFVLPRPVIETGHGMGGGARIEEGSLTAARNYAGAADATKPRRGFAKSGFFCCIVAHCWRSLFGWSVGVLSGQTNPKLKRGGKPNRAERFFVRKRTGGPGEGIFFNFFCFRFFFYRGLPRERTNRPNTPPTRGGKRRFVFFLENKEGSGAGYGRSGHKNLGTGSEPQAREFGGSGKGRRKNARHGKPHKPEGRTPARRPVGKKRAKRGRPGL